MLFTGLRAQAVTCLSKSIGSSSNRREEMDKITLNRERRRLSTLERLRSNHPKCSCGECDWRCLQLVPTHGARGDGCAVIICRNCRFKQLSIPKSVPKWAGKACIVCTESDPRCLELHHIAGRGFAPDCVIACRNCHAKLSDMQRDHSQ